MSKKIYIGSTEIAGGDGRSAYQIWLDEGNVGTEEQFMASLNGVGIASVTQTTTSSVDGGTNVWTVTKTDGTSSTFQVKNGNQGNSGYSGAAGDLEVVNNLIDGGQTSALSAEMGKRLNAEGVRSVSSEGFYLTDSSGNVALSYTDSGLNAAKVHPNLLSQLVPASSNKTQEAFLYFANQTISASGQESDSSTYKLSNKIPYVGEFRVEFSSTVKVFVNYHNGTSRQNSEVYTEPFTLTNYAEYLRICFCYADDSELDQNILESSKLRFYYKGEDVENEGDKYVVMSGVEYNQVISETLAESIFNQEYEGGYIEIQPDSYSAGNAPSVDTTSNLWGFPVSLSNSEQTRLKELVFQGGGKGLQYIRFPLGFGYRGYRNIDQTTGLAKNIGERFSGQNAALKKLFSKIAESGGGLSPEYWCPPVYWITGGAYSNRNYITSVTQNDLWAGGSYSRDITLASIKTSNPTQYAAQIDAFTDAVVDDLEYLHQNVAPVRLFSLQGEPDNPGREYGSCHYDAQTYNDVLEVLWPKILASTVLSTWNGEKNTVKLYAASAYRGTNTSPFTGVASVFLTNHSDWLWGYSHSSYYDEAQNSASYYRDSYFLNSVKGERENVFTPEFEYTTAVTLAKSPEWRCANTMQHLINEARYGKAKVLHPIIHVCKQLGQNAQDSNTSGYGMFMANLPGSYGYDMSSNNNPYNMAKGTFMPVAQNYNAWCLMKDLPIGSVMIGDNPVNTSNNLAWCVFKAGGKYYIYAANSNRNSGYTLRLSFGDLHRFSGKICNIRTSGSPLSDIEGSTIDIVVPPCSGVALEETNSDKII